MAASEDNPGLRSKRLSDVQRGTQNWRALDVMASSQWTAHADFYARRVPQVTSQSYDLSPSWQRGRLSVDTDVTSGLEPPSYVISDAEDDDDEEEEESDDRFPSYRQLPLVETGRVPRPGGRHRLRRGAGGQGGGEAGPVNCWDPGREAELEAKLTPDPLPRVIRPRQPVIMSRVGGKQGRQLRTITDFRSRNGTVRVIEPVLEASPRLGSLARPLVEAPDPEQVERETTYVMLRRIDKILHPERVFARPDRSSSELEVFGSSESSSLTEVLGSPESDMLDQPPLLQPRQHGGGNLARDLLQWRLERCRPQEHRRQRKSREGQMLPKRRTHNGHVTSKHGLAPLNSQPAAPLASRRGDNRIDVPAHQRHQHARPEVKALPTSTARLSPLVRELDRKELDSYQKCQYWIDKWLIVN